MTGYDGAVTFALQEIIHVFLFASTNPNNKLISVFHPAYGATRIFHTIFATTGNRTHVRAELHLTEGTLIQEALMKKYATKPVKAPMRLLLDLEHFGYVRRQYY